MNFVTIVPAYGRDYRSKKAVMADWDAGKDFRIDCFMHPDDGRYINKQDADSTPGVTYNIRYQKLTKVLPVKIKVAA
jgi:hypothetical protein